MRCVMDGANPAMPVRQVNQAHAATSDHAVTSDRESPANAATLDRRPANAGSVTTATRRP